MPKPFDATLKDLIEAYPRDWLAQLDLPTTQAIEVIDADLSTVTAQADKVLRIHDPDPWLLHFELQSGRDPHLGRRVLKYNVLLHDHHGVPVHTVVVLLRREADDMSLTGDVTYHPPHGHGSMDFHFQVVRIWQRPVDAILTGGLGTLPLAPLSDVTPEGLPAVIRRMEERLAREAGPAMAATLWTATYILMGLRYSSELATQLLQGVRSMKESSTYQAILSEGEAKGEARGRLQEAKNLLFLLGSKRLGLPDPQTRAAIEVLDDIEQLEQLTARLLDVSTWQELLAPTNSGNAPSS